MRIACCVPFCRRTTAAEKISPHNEWICVDHWKLVSKSIKRRRAKLRRILKWESNPDRTGRIIYADNLLWTAAKKQAIERAAGI